VPLTDEIKMISVDDHSLWPNSRVQANKVFAQILTDEVRQIVEDNARALFHLPG
jgi:hypothetical protein